MCPESFATMDPRDHRSADTDKQIMAVIRDCAAVQTAAEFSRFMEGPFFDVMPHERLVCGIHGISDQGSQVHKVLDRNPPRAYFEALLEAAGTVDTPLTKKWRTTRLPEGFQSGRDDHEFPQEWVSIFNRFKLKNVIGHGVTDIAGTLGSFFLFYGVAGELGPEHASLLKIMVPHLHLALLRAAPTIENPEILEASRKTLNERQRKILHWLNEGKTNWEIAKILNVSERNVKYNLKQIFLILDVHSRAHAVAKANDLGLLLTVRT